MNVGTLINIETKNSLTKKIKKYRCTVIEKSNQALIVDYPINVKNNKTSFLPVGTSISVTYVAKDKVVYQFKSMIIKKVKGKIPALVIEYPDKSNIKRIQRREFVRVDTAVDVAIHSVNRMFTPFTTVTTDISGGGLSIISPKEDIVKIGDKVKAYIILPVPKYQFISVEAEVLFIKLLKNNLYTVSLKFTKIENHQQQMIIRYCFERQRKARQKELQ